MGRSIEDIEAEIADLCQKLDALRAEARASVSQAAIGVWRADWRDCVVDGVLRALTSEWRRHTVNLGHGYDVLIEVWQPGEDGDDAFPAEQSDD